MGEDLVPGDVLGERDAPGRLLHRHAHLAERQDIAVDDFGGLDCDAIPVGVQPAADIGDPAGAAVDLDDGVPPRDAAMMQNQVIVGRTADRRRTLCEHVAVGLAVVVVEEGEHCADCRSPVANGVHS